MSSSARIDELRRKFDENPRRYFAPLANEYRKAGDFDQAIFICQEYLPQQPGHMSGHIVFGQALFEAKRLPEARTVFETALTLDPENLIALRHLADISRELGEFGPAKVWYERVLQADPRNEEIAAIMASMAAPASAPIGSSAVAPTAETPAIASTVAPVRASPSSGAAAPTMELSAAAVQEMVKARQAAQAAQTAKDERRPELISLDNTTTVEINTISTPPTLEGFESTRSEEIFDIPSGGMLGLEPTSAASPPAEPTVERPAAEELDTITLDDFSLPTIGSTAATPPEPSDSDGLLDLGSFGFSAPTEAPAQSVASGAPPLDLSIDAEAGPMDFDLDVPPAASTANATAPTLDSVPTVVMDAIPEIVAQVIDAADELLPFLVDDVPPPVDAETTPTVIIDAIRVNPPTPEPRPTEVPEPELVLGTPETDGALVADGIDPERHVELEPNSPEPTESETAVAAAPPFVTETMAQLYLEQGHREEAIDIYRQLLAARPTDAALRSRLRVVEQQGQTSPPAKDPIAAVPASVVTGAGQGTAVPPSSRFSVGGPTIREVLRGVLGVDAQSANGDAFAHNEPGAEVGSIDTLFSAEALADSPSPLAVAFDGGYVAVPGTIDAVFVGGA